MKQSQIAARIDARVKHAVEQVCKARGLKMGRFVEEALLDKLEELEDVEDVKRIRFEPTRPVSELLRARPRASWRVQWMR
jgi:antitoxin component of RelBE/YafQ-DinJ toxin-antitoxin module